MPSSNPSTPGPDRPTHPPRPETATPSRRPPDASAAVEPLMVRKAEARRLLGDMPERSFERAVASGKVPKPDRIIGKTPYWNLAKLRAWADGRGAR